mmetsp:Transcript_78952/g.231752  ORF Transcript_78952/g.231752 Transcript_78952/m.231752 type:complete len:444 (+) Transcript_78952:931-2262(+)
MVPLLANDDHELWTVVVAEAVEGLGQFVELVGQDWGELAVGNAVAVVQDVFRQVAVCLVPQPQQLLDHGAKLHNPLLALAAPLLLDAEDEGALGAEVGEVGAERPVAGGHHACHANAAAVVGDISTDDHGASCWLENGVWPLQLHVVCSASAVGPLRQLRRDFEHEVIELQLDSLKLRLVPLARTVHALRGKAPQVQLRPRLQRAVESLALLLAGWKQHKKQVRAVSGAVDLLQLVPELLATLQVVQPLPRPRLGSKPDVVLLALADPLCNHAVQVLLPAALGVAPDPPANLEARRVDGGEVVCVAVGCRLLAVALLQACAVQHTARQRQHVRPHAHAHFLQRLARAKVAVATGHQGQDLLLPVLRHHGRGLPDSCLVLRLQLPSQDVVLPTEDRDELKWHTVASRLQLQAWEVWTSQLAVVVILEVVLDGYVTILLMVEVVM